MSTYFVSDTHLSTARSERVADFLTFLERCAPAAERIYVLGDLFDLCLGDDDDLPPNGEIKQALARATDTGTPVYFMRGNHDFLMTDDFGRQTGCTMLDDPSLVELNGRRVLLLHGDALCTDDVEYQAYKADIRAPETLTRLRGLDITQRLARAREVIDISRTAVEHKPASVMDVNRDAVVDAFRQHDAEFMIHGHTHKPGYHQYAIDGRTRHRYVLGDWYVGTSVLTWNAGQPEFTTVKQLLSTEAPGT